MTPAKRLGFYEGEKFMVTRPNHFLYGTTITLIEDDGTSVPFFRTESHSEEIVCVSINDITKLPETAQPPEPTTPAEGKGIKVGDRVRLVKKENTTIKVEDRASVGDIFILHRDDGSRKPWFLKEGKGEEGNFCPDIYDVVKIEEDNEMTVNEETGIQVTEVKDFRQNGVESGDQIITKEHKRYTVDHSSNGPDGDDEFSVLGGYVKADDILHVYRVSYIESEVTVEVTINRKDAQKIAQLGGLFESIDVEDYYSDSFRSALERSVKAMSQELNKKDELK